MTETLDFDFSFRTAKHHQQSAGNISGSVETAVSASLCPGDVTERRTVRMEWMKTAVCIKLYLIHFKF